ncbi:Formation of crista junctions protein 1 [Apophysomyces ossiformis]|uniref:MICOS complex subunit MIC60 n=1 Tax=Apophysomyces ossiformis TaxID=679940 RepID=A0A8H7BFZ1_9FUNG|nr:Formation of crista junctions protein 1 [Apophysomyces ossiformis]
MLRSASLLTRATIRKTGRQSGHSVTRCYTTGQEPVKNSSSIGRKLLWTTVIGASAYGGATYLALHNEAFHDTYTTYIPGGSQLLDTLEDLIEDEQLKGYYQKSAEWANLAATHSVLLKDYAIKAKDASLDAYEYASDAVAQLTGRKEAPQLPSSQPPAPLSRGSKNIRKGGLFAHVVNDGEPVAIPDFPITNEAAVDDLASTVQQLVGILNEAGLTGHAKRLVSFASRDFDMLKTAFEHLRSEQAKVSKDVKALEHSYEDVKTHVEEHCAQVEAKAQSAKQRSDARVAEKAEKLKNEFEAEGLALKQQLLELGQKELDQQKAVYLEKLSHELKEQVIETQRRYVREVRQQVETERGGRLANVDQVVTRQSVLERLSYANAEHIDDSRKAHQLLVAVDALKRAAYSGDRKAFLEELQAILTISAPSSPFANVAERKNDEIVQTVASNISETVARHGIDSMSQLINRFETVAREVRRASLIPEEGSSMISHIISILLSKVMFTKQGLVPGEDIEARLARAQYYLTRNNDLESAAREMNQLKGWPKTLALDWLDAARRHLEVKQALEIMRTQATLTSMLQTE